MASRLQLQDMDSNSSSSRRLLEDSKVMDRLRRAMVALPGMVTRPRPMVAKPLDMASSNRDMANRVEAAVVMANSHHHSLEATDKVAVQIAVAAVVMAVSPAAAEATKVVVAAAAVVVAAMGASLVVAAAATEAVVVAAMAAAAPVIMVVAVEEAVTAAAVVVVDSGVEAAELTKAILPAPAGMANLRCRPSMTQSLCRDCHQL